MTKDQAHLIAAINNMLKMRPSVIAIAEISNIVQPLLPDSELHTAVQVTLADHTTLTIVII